MFSYIRPSYIRIYKATVPCAFSMTSSLLKAKIKMEKNYSSSDLENEKNTFIYDNYNLDISENENFFSCSTGLANHWQYQHKNCRFVHQNILKTVHSVV